MAAPHPSMAALFGADERWTRLPPNPMASLFVAMVYQRLGGWFCIDSRGKRGIGQPLYSSDDELPQLPNANPRERFHNSDEWQGAIKLLDALLHRMDPDDTNTIFDLMAAVAVDERGFTPSIEEPKRGPSDAH